MDIVKEIVTEIKNLLPTLTGFTQLDYEYNISNNNERGLSNKFGFIPLEASFEQGRSIGFVTVNHTFQLILCSDFRNIDDDTAQSETNFYLYNLVHKVISNLEKKPFSLPTVGNTINMINGISLDPLETNLENGISVLRININIQYKYKKV